MVTADAPAIRSAELLYSRWKPQVSTTCVYQLRFEDGAVALLVYKRYIGAKARVLVDRAISPARPYEARQWLSDRAVLTDRGIVLWTPEADRELGMRFLLDLKRFPKLLRDSGLVEPGKVRRRRTDFHLLRYKPERRAVYRVDLKLRDRSRTRLSMAARVLPSRIASEIVTRRAAFEKSGGAEFSPPLLCAHARHGILVEPWLSIQCVDEADFKMSREAGELLARLHGLSAPGPEVEAVFELESLAPLFQVDADLAARLARIAGRGPAPRCRTTWIHGDFHPDQVVVYRSGAFLMDLDCIRPGDPADDLASWVADHLYERPAASWQSAADALFEGYEFGGGQVPPLPQLQTLVAYALIARGAASIRRLELGGVERARSAFCTAEGLLAAN